LIRERKSCWISKAGSLANVKDVMQNIHQSEIVLSLTKGLYSGTRVIIKVMHENYLKVEVLADILIGYTDILP
jgi:hypothetical protein